MEDKKIGGDVGKEDYDESFAIRKSSYGKLTGLFYISCGAHHPLGKAEEFVTR